MKKKDLLEEQFKEFKLSSLKTKVILGGAGVGSTTGDTDSGEPLHSDDCDSDNDSPAPPAMGAGHGAGAGYGG